MAKTLVTFVDDLYEDLELWYPKGERAGRGGRPFGFEPHPAGFGAVWEGDGGFFGP